MSRPTLQHTHKCWSNVPRCTPEHIAHAIYKVQTLSPMRPLHSDVESCWDSRKNRSCPLTRVHGRLHGGPMGVRTHPVFSVDVRNAAVQQLGHQGIVPLFNGIKQGICAKQRHPPTSVLRGASQSSIHVHALWEWVVLIWCVIPRVAPFLGNTGRVGNLRKLTR